MRLLLLCLSLFQFSLSYANSITGKMSFSHDEKLFSFGASYDLDSEITLGVDHSRDISGSQLIERNSRLWSLLFFDKFSLSPALIYSKDNDDRVGKGVELGIDYFLNDQWTFIFKGRLKSFDEDILRTSNLLVIQGKEDYINYSLKYGLEYSYNRDLIFSCYYQREYYDDNSSVDIKTSSNILIRNEKGFATRSQYAENFGLSLDYSRGIYNFFYSIDRSHFVLIDDIEYWNTFEVTRSFKKIKLLMSFEHENIEDNLFVGLGAKYYY